MIATTGGVIILICSRIARDLASSRVIEMGTVAGQAYGAAQVLSAKALSHE